MEKLTAAATNHLKKVWREYDGIKIIVSERNGKFSVQVKDSKNLYNFNQRSDGFKRFISFLLILSADSRSEKLPKNAVLIFDEPDISLHPSGTRHLLREILELSKKNYSFSASHSIFFIDRENIERHVIVSKDNECTLIKPATYQNFAEEEVLYQALGCSLFDILKPKNLCFEGWTDKEIYKIMCDLFTNDIDNLNEFVPNYGVLWSSSASKICQTIKPFIGNYNERNFYAVSDFDIAGKNEKEKFEDEFQGTNNKFFTYKEFSGRDLTQLTIEDLLPVDLLLEVLNTRLKQVLTNQPPVLFTKDKIEKNGIIHAWESFCSKEYRPLKDQLAVGYKNTIPDKIRDYIKKNEGNIAQLRDEFSFYRTFLKNLMDKLSAGTAPTA